MSYRITSTKNSLLLHTWSNIGSFDRDMTTTIDLRNRIVENNISGGNHEDVHERNEIGISPYVPAAISYLMKKYTQLS